MLYYIVIIVCVFIYNINEGKAIDIDSIKNNPLKNLIVTSQKQNIGFQLNNKNRLILNGN